MGANLIWQSYRLAGPTLVGPTFGCGCITIETLSPPRRFC